MLENLKGKKIAIAGFGREGQSVLSFLARNRLPAAVLDESTAVAVPAGVETHLGPDALSHAKDFDVVFRSPGISRIHAQFRVAEAKGVRISSLTKLFFELCPSPIIGVTGTKGKGTVSSLIAHFLKSAQKKVFLGGNVGVTLLESLGDMEASSTVVLELSSFQLQDLDMSPHIAVVLNITPDHMDLHKSLAEYVDAKANILTHQKPGDIAVLNADSDEVKKLALKTKGRRLWYSTRALAEPGAFYKDGGLFVKLGPEEVEICRDKDLPLRGEHNIGNVLAAATVAVTCGATATEIRNGLSTFRPLPGRLEEVARVSEVLYVNDTLATTPHAAAAALRAYSQPKVIIVGGSEKNADYSPLAEQILKSDIRGVVTIGRTGKKIMALLSQIGYSGALAAGGDTMPQIVSAAAALARPGDVVLLSPASASFDMFKNYQDRGAQFAAAVKALRDNI